MWRVPVRCGIAAALLALSCGGGAKSGTTGAGGSPGAGGSADGGAPDGGDNGGQVLPPYLGRIVLAPAAMLFTGAGQSATLHAQAFDASGASMSIPLTFTSSRPDQIAVDASGKVTSMVPVGSAQITATGGGLRSQPLLVLAVQPQPGTVLISDAQVVAGPKQVDPTADPLPGAQYQVTLDGAGDLAPGTMLLSREGNAVAGQVVSTAPNGTHTDVIYTLPALLDLAARLDFQAGYDYTLQTVADEAAIAAMKGSALEMDVGVFSCKTGADFSGLTIDQSVKITPNLHFTAQFTKDDDSGDWTSASVRLTGNIKISGKVTAKLAPGAIVSASCKYKWKEFIPPIGGPLSAVVGPRIPVGVKAGIKAQATIDSAELGGKLEDSADFDLGFSYGMGGTGDIATFNLADPHVEPVYSVNKDIVLPAADISISLGAFASINVTAAELGIADAFVGAKLKYTMMSLLNQIGSNTPNKYELKPVTEVSPGDLIGKALKLFKGLLNFTTSISEEGAVIATSPTGTFTADNQKIDVPANKPINFQIKLDPASTKFLGLDNVSGIHIYRVDNPPVLMAPLNEVQYLNGPGPNYTWTWTPKVTDAGPHLFLVGLDDELVYSLTPGGDPPQFWVSPGIQVNVGQTAGNWGGTASITWNGSGALSNGGTETVQGTETITWVPGMSTIDGMSFDMVATNVTFSYTLTDTFSSSIAGCPATETYKVTTSKTLTGADADMQAHQKLLVIPIPGSMVANYQSGIPGITVEAPATDDNMSLCGMSMHLDTLTGASEGDGAPMMGMIFSDATTIEGSANFTARGTGGGVPTNYVATWSLQKM